MKKRGDIRVTVNENYLNNVFLNYGMKWVIILKLCYLYNFVCF